MKQTTTLILLGSLALGTLAVGIAGAIRKNRKARKREPAPTFRDLYEDNAASGTTILYEGGDN